MTASVTAQPIRLDSPTSGEWGVIRHTAARAASLNTDHTLTILHERIGDRPSASPPFTLIRCHSRLHRRRSGRLEICIARRAPADYGMPMKFLDEAKVYIRSGDGGNGCVSFRREKFIEYG